MDLALCKLEYEAADIPSVATDGKYLYFSPKYIFQMYQDGTSQLNHAHLHLIMHCVLYHPFVSSTLQHDFWDLACDIAVEGIIDELDLKQVATANSIAIHNELGKLQAKYGKLTAERLYRKFISTKISHAEFSRLQKIFCVDQHDIWYADPDDGQSKQQPQQPEEQKKPGESGGAGDADNQDPSQNPERNSDNTSDSLSDAPGIQNNQSTSVPQPQSQSQSIEDEWKEISERVKVDIETASKEWGDRSANLRQNIAEVNREKYDYSDFLQKFSVMGEEMQINDDEFDYIFYTYGLQLYKNVPLVEPLEYKDVKKIKDFVIAIDTSGSVQGTLVQKFITKTYNILAQQNNFFTQINVHIIQCDAEIQKDDKITSLEELESYIKTIELKGFGGTDFCPVFSYVDKLKQKGEFSNLKGLIYFTDGWGSFPEKKPDYDAAFIFVDDSYNNYDVPVWAIKLVLAKDEI